MVEAFTEYLQGRSVGEGAKSIYARFKKVIKYAIEHDAMLKNPCTGITIKVDDQQLRKEVLSPEEIQQLIATHYEHENPNIRRAFIFCLYCGLRYCDVKDLTFANVDFSNKLLKFEQNKDEVIFPLPSYEMCLKALRRWVKRAGINKHISWHCGRHINPSYSLKTIGVR